jgi:hypothetical protein
VPPVCQMPNCACRGTAKTRPDRSWRFDRSRGNSADGLTARQSHGRLRCGLCKSTLPRDGPKTTHRDDRHGRRFAPARGAAAFSLPAAIQAMQRHDKMNRQRRWHGRGSVASRCQTCERPGRGCQAVGRVGGARAANARWGDSLQNTGDGSCAIHERGVLSTGRTRTGTTDDERLLAQLQTGQLPGL